MKGNYLSEEEMKMDRDMVNLQIVLGLQTCETKGDVCKLLDDVREHERRQIMSEFEVALKQCPSDD